MANEDAFSEMKSHIFGLYEDVEAAHNFVDETGAIFDCIPIEQQPALRGSSKAVPKAPDLPPLEAPDAAENGAGGAGREAAHYGRVPARRPPQASSWVSEDLIITC